MTHQRAAWNNVRGFERLSLCDWPGRSSCVVFVGGCNLRCPTCHNAGMAWRPERLPVVPRESILAYIEGRKKWLDGVTVTGGEPTIVRDLATILADIARIGLPIKLDTNGMRPDVVRDLLNSRLVCTFAVDVKGPWEKYPALTGGAVSAEDARANLEEIFQLAERVPQAFYFRTTKVPLLTDEDIATARGYVPAGLTVREQTYVPPGRTQHAETDSETGRMPGDVVSGTDRGSDIQSPEVQRHQGSAAVQAACS